MAVSSVCPVGVDVEEVRHIPEADHIAKRWFSSEEFEWMGKEEDPNRAFLRCWVRREAFVKAIGTGLAFPLDSFTLPPPPEGIEKRMGNRIVLGREILIDAESVGALAVLSTPVCRHARSRPF